MDLGYEIWIKDRVNPRRSVEREMIKGRMENLLKTNRRKTIATIDRTIYDLDSDKPNQKDIKIKKIITRVK